VHLLPRKKEKKERKSIGSLANGKEIEIGAA